MGLNTDWEDLLIHYAIELAETSTFHYFFAHFPERVAMHTGLDNKYFCIWYLSWYNGLVYALSLR